MPKKVGINTKVEAARARKSAVEEEREERETREKEEQYWRNAEGSKSRATKKREEEADKRAEADARRAEARRLAELEEKELDTSIKKPLFLTAQSEDGTGIRKYPCIFEDEKWKLRLVKQTRTASESRCSNWTQVEPDSISSINMGNSVQVQEENGRSLNAERLTGSSDNGKENHWHNNLEQRLSGKRKRCDLNVNVDINLECSWPLFTETLDEEDSYETSDSDSDAFSGPS